MNQDGWVLRYDGLDAAGEGLREALCTLGNGYLATRGALAETAADGVHYPGTYLAGVYNRLSSEVAGRVVENESLVNVANWLPLQFRVDGGPWIDDTTAEVLEHRLELDLRRGVLTRHTRFALTSGVVDGETRQLRLTQRRIVSMADAHLAAIETTIVAENFSGTVVVRSALDGSVTNSGVARYRELPSQHLTPVSTSAPHADTTCLVMETNQSHIRIAEAARTRYALGGGRHQVDQCLVDGQDVVALETAVAVAPGQELVVDKVVAVFTSRDAGISEPGLDAVEHVGRAPGFPELLDAHVVAWRHRWQRTEIELDTNHDTALLLHLHMFHVMTTVSPHSALLDAGVPARGLHGEAYRGHIFWDELFIFPFFSLRLPELTRALLLYRYRRLDQARALAADAGFAGAMFPWQSGSNGREETQTVHLNPASGHWLPDASHLQRHVNAAVAYNVWHYYQATGDEEFMRFFGAEMLLEIAQLWSSMAEYDHSRDRYVIRGVMGPDEYHERYPGSEEHPNVEPGLDNNAYTNVMAVWCVCRALEVLEAVPTDVASALRERLGITRQELDRWADISHKMWVPFHDGGGVGDEAGPVLSQFEGYDQLLELDWDSYRSRYGDIARLDRILEAEGDTTNRYQLTKQADVLMLFFLLSAEEFGELLDRLGIGHDAGLIPRTVAYYEPRTAHGSTLSRVVHAWVHARSDRVRSWHEFVDALHSDINDVQGGTTAEGIHMGAMAGTIDLIQRCYTGIELRQDELRLDPQLPAELGSLRMSLQYRGQAVSLQVADSVLRVQLGQAATAAINVRVRGELRLIAPGSSAEFDLAD